jgi:hypothetical protein
MGWQGGRASLAGRGGCALMRRSLRAQRLAIGLGYVEHRDRAEQCDRLVCLLAPVVVPPLDDHRCHDLYAVLALADLPAELLPCLESRDVCSLRGRVLLVIGLLTLALTLVRRRSE